MIGIYKITSPSGKIYIGQSVNIEHRLIMYKGLHCHKQVKLHASFVKYGFNNHAFEIIEECEESLLNEREIFYIDQYSTLNKETGLNLTTGGRSFRRSEETKRKISKSKMGKKRPDVSARLKNLKGRKLTKEQIDIIIKRNTGLKRSAETKKMMSEKAKQRIWTEDCRKNMSESAKKKVLSEDHKTKLKEWSKIGYIGKIKSKKTIEIATGKIYNSLTELCNEKGLKYDRIKQQLNGQTKKNTTGFRYLDDMAKAS